MQNFFGLINLMKLQCTFATIYHIIYREIRM